MNTTEQPVPLAWRPVFEQIVAAFAEGDFRLTRGIDGVEPVSEATAQQIQSYIEDYGAALRELPSETWETSIASGAASGAASTWEVLVDLWTEEEGRSDLVLHADVTEHVEGLRVSIHLVYVP